MAIRVGQIVVADNSKAALPFQEERLQEESRKRRQVCCVRKGKRREREEDLGRRLSFLTTRIANLT